MCIQYHTAFLWRSAVSYQECCMPLERASDGDLKNIGVKVNLALMLQKMFSLS